MRCRRFVIQLPVSVILALVLSCAALTTARGFLLKDRPEEPGLGGYGYVLFTSRPSADNLKRYVAVCDSYLRQFPPASAYGDVPRQELMITFWLLEVDAASPRELEDCDWLVNHYDYARANRTATVIEMAGQAGPILAATSGAPIRDSKLQSVTVDMSRFTDGDIDRAFQVWKTQVSKDPRFWQSGLKVALFREAFRNLLNQYGDEIMKLVGAE